MILSSPKQRQRLGYFRKLLNLSEDLYRELLEQFGVETSKNLTSHQIEELTTRLAKNAQEQGLYKPKPSFLKYKYNNLAKREGMATPAQLRKIDIMWKNISRQKNEKDRESALQVMIKKITGKDHIKFLTPLDVRKVIKTFENM
ncbi:MAG: regulatory protein GemA [Candidatus Gastranaerophilaceae bacterium]